jgi:hypothetical protein
MSEHSQTSPSTTGVPIMMFELLPTKLFFLLIVHLSRKRFHLWPAS